MKVTASVSDGRQVKQVNSLCRQPEQKLSDYLDLFVFTGTFHRFHHLLSICAAYPLLPPPRLQSPSPVLSRITTEALEAKPKWKTRTRIWYLLCVFSSTPSIFASDLTSWYRVISDVTNRKDIWNGSSHCGCPPGAPLLWFRASCDEAPGILRVYHYFAFPRQGILLHQIANHPHLNSNNSRFIG